MEIPIQVAVRIHPYTGESPYQAAFDANGNTDGPIAITTKDAADEDENTKCRNGNNDGESVDESPKTNEMSTPCTNGIETGVKCCVQAFPMVAAMMPYGYLSSATSTSPLPVLSTPMGDNSCSIGTDLVQVGPHSFPVTHALPADCTQNQVYERSVFPLISLFLEGFDASVVTYGQQGTGKTYTLYGPGFECVYGETDQGVVQRSVRDIFTHMSNHPERTYAVNLGWVGICRYGIRDLLGVGNVLCATVSDVFHWMQVGFLTLKSEPSNPLAHTLFTLTLEQQWVSKDNLIQHRLSTASFSDLCGTQRIFCLDALGQTTSMPKDEGLQALELVVNTLTDPTLMYGVNGNIPYHRTPLTTLLKDSFGGRAQTLLLLCVSALERDIDETICNIQFVFKVQCVRNYVILNTFSDDNTPICPPVKTMPSITMGCRTSGYGPNGSTPTGVDQFGLQFAASQWLKLVSNAEGLFAKLAGSTAISELDKEQIEEWLFLKQECEECLSSSDVLLRSQQKQLVPIQEADEEPEEALSEADTTNSCQQNSDNDDDDDDSESQLSSADMIDKLESLMEEFSQKTDKVVMSKYKEFILRQPKAVMDSSQEDSSVRRHRHCRDEAVLIGDADEDQVALEKYDERKASIGGRRRSIQPGASLSSAEIAMLNRVATREQVVVAEKTSSRCAINDFLDSSNEKSPLHAINSPLEVVQRQLRKLNAEIESRRQQIEEVEQTIQLKQGIIADLVKNSETRTHAKQRFNKKQAKLEFEYEKAKKHLSKGIEQGLDAVEVERRCALLSHLDQRIKDIHSIKQIAGESVQKLKRLQQSLQESKKLLDELNKKAKKERKLRDQLETEERALHEKEKRNIECQATVKTNSIVTQNYEDSGGKNLKDMQARIAHLDHVLREKSHNLEVGRADSANIAGAESGTMDTKNSEALRHEIRNLRRTRDHLLEQRCSLDRKLKREKVLSQREERKLLECDEAIEAIDAAIEFKNELICGHKSIDTSERLQREKGEQMLMERLNKLSVEEMRTLLYKYFNKVIDLRESSRKLEVQLMQLERERDSWEWKERVLSNAVRQARLEGERNTVLLQRQQEMKLALMVRHLAEETSGASSASYGETIPPYVAALHQRLIRSPGQPQPPANHTLSLAAVASLPGQQNQAEQSSSTATDSEFDYGFYKNTTAMAMGNTAATSHHSKLHLKAVGKHGGVEGMSDALSKYKPLDKFKEKERESKNKLFAKFQVLTRYASGGSGGNGGSGGGGGGGGVTNHHDGYGAGGGGGTAATGNNSRKKDKHATLAVIPQENLKRLNANPPATKVTRQKNKIIIQDATR